MLKKGSHYCYLLYYMKKTVVQILLTGNAGITVECRDKSGNAINGSGNADLD